jgi:hypothetical protein
VLYQKIIDVFDAAQDIGNIEAKVIDCWGNILALDLWTFMFTVEKETTL